MSTIWAFDRIENKHGVYRSEDCMKRFCRSLKEHAMNEKNKMIPVTNKERKSCAIKKSVTFAKIFFKLNTLIIQKSKIKLEIKFSRDHCHSTDKYRCAANSICNLRYNTPKQIALVFHKDQTMTIILL